MQNTPVLPTKLIVCPRSGLPLATVTAMCTHGWPMLSSFQANLYHPVYAFPLEKLIVNLDRELKAAEQIAWCVEDRVETEIKLNMSAIMYALNAIWQPPVEATYLWKQLEPSLPSWAVAIGTGSRLVQLAGWYHYATSKRLSFPSYRVSTKNDNIEWQNFGSWLTEAFEIKTEWESGRDKLAQEDELRKRTAALLEVRAEHIYKRIDFNKVWNWIDVQMKLDSKYPAGRRETFKSIFMKGDTNPEEWTVDDIEDVHFAVVETCDMGNEISFFINNRLRQIKAVIEDFYSSFTLISSIRSDSLDALDATTPQEQAASNAFFSTFDKRANELDTLPEAPKRESFATYPKFLQAQAQWNILKRRYDMKVKDVKDAKDVKAIQTQGEQA